MLQRFNKMRNEEGFTLIELLIVIIVLGILVAIVLFSLGTFKSDSASSACKADVKQVQTAETAYNAATGGYTATLSNLTTAQTVNGVSKGPWLQAVPTSNNYTITANGSTGVVTGTLSASNGGGTC